MLALGIAHSEVIQRSDATPNRFGCDFSCEYSFHYTVQAHYADIY